MPPYSPLASPRVPLSNANSIFYEVTVVIASYVVAGVVEVVQGLSGQLRHNLRLRLRRDEGASILRLHLQKLKDFYFYIHTFIKK